jgi:hypothetical protein
MSSVARKKTYRYSAQGHGLSAQLDRPLEHLIEVQAASSLPTIGGHGSSRVNHFRFQEFVSFDSAYTHVSGSQKQEDGTYTTLVTATVESLNVLDVVTADRVVARLASQHPTEHDEPHVVFLGSKFENLRIAGCPVDAELNHDLFLRMDTFASIRKEFETNAEFRKMAEDPFQSGDLQKLPDAHGALLCSLVKDIKTTCPGVKRIGHCLVVPQFGKIFLAEVMARHATRTLTMLRLELGSPVSGTLTVTETVINGHTWP